MDGWWPPRLEMGDHSGMGEEDGETAMNTPDPVPDPVDVAAEILNWTGDPGCFPCDVYGPSCPWHGVPDLRKFNKRRLP